MTKIKWFFNMSGSKIHADNVVCMESGWGHFTFSPLDSYKANGNKGNNKITELQTILQRESQNS
jgi:hypothetical protein